MNNIDWDHTLVGKEYRKTMCRIGIWFLNRAGIQIVEWEEVEEPR